MANNEEQPGDDAHLVHCKCGAPAYRLIMSRPAPDAALELERVERPDGDPIPEDAPLTCPKCGARINHLTVDKPAIVKTSGQITPLAVAPSTKPKARAKRR